MDNMNHESFAPIDITAALRLTWRHLRRLWWIPAVLALLFGARSLIGTIHSYHPMYQTSAILSVSTGAEDGSYSFYADSSATERVVDTFSYILNSEVMSEQLRLELGGALGGSVRAEFVDGTSLFALIATSADPQKAVDLINAVITVYPQVSTPILGNTQLKVIESAPLPTEPYNSISGFSGVVPNAVTGALIGLAVIVLYALARSTVANSDDVKKMVNLKCLAKVPRVAQKARKSGKMHGLLITRETHSGFRESFHLLRARLTRQLSPDDKIILFTSSVPSEGKSSIAVNTALSLAREGRRVLLMDADLRHPLGQCYFSNGVTLQTHCSQLVLPLAGDGSQIVQQQSGLQLFKGVRGRYCCLIHIPPLRILPPCRVTEEGCDALAHGRPGDTGESVHRQLRFRQIAADGPEEAKGGDVVILADLPTPLMEEAVDQVVIFSGELSLRLRHGLRPGRLAP